jgi:hypothetical protein
MCNGILKLKIIKMKYAPNLYKCPSCFTEQKHYTWDSEVTKKKFKCINPECKSKVGAKDIYFPPVVNVPAIKTPTVNRFYNGVEGRKQILEKFLHKPTMKKNNQTAAELAKK